MFEVSWFTKWFIFWWQERYVVTPTWEDACRVADVVENYGYDVTIRRR